MSDLTAFRDHCAHMATAESVTAEDRARFASLAAEIDTWLGRGHDETEGLFG